MHRPIVCVVAFVCSAAIEESDMRTVMLTVLA
jgi:hypothetical protein